MAESSTVTIASETGSRPRGRRMIASLAFAVTCTAGLVATAAGDKAAAQSTPSTTCVGYVSDSGTIVPIDLETGALGTPIRVGPRPGSIAVTRDGTTAYVANRGDNTVTPVDLTTQTAGTPIPVGASPSSVAITPDGTTAFAVTSTDFTSDMFLVSIDLASQSAGAPIPLPARAHDLAITPDGATVFIPLTGASGGAGGRRVAYFDIATNTLVGTISVGNFPSSIAITPDGATVYIAEQDVITTERFVRPIDVDDKEAGALIPLGASGRDIAIAPDGVTAYVLTGNNAVVPLDIATNTLGEPIPVPSRVFNLEITPDGSTAFVVSFGDGSASMLTPIDLATGVPGASIEVGAGVDIAIGNCPAAPTAADFACSVDGDGLNWTDLGERKYRVRYSSNADGSDSRHLGNSRTNTFRAKNRFGTYTVITKFGQRRLTTSCTAPGGPALPTFDCVFDGEVLTWSDQGIDRYNVRRDDGGNNRYVATVTDSRTLVVGDPDGDYIVVVYIEQRRTTTRCHPAVG